LINRHFFDSRQGKQILKKTVIRDRNIDSIAILATQFGYFSPQIEHTDIGCLAQRLRYNARTLFIGSPLLRHSIMIEDDRDENPQGDDQNQEEK